MLHSFSDLHNLNQVTADPMITQTSQVYHEVYTIKRLSMITKVTSGHITGVHFTNDFQSTAISFCSYPNSIHVIGANIYTCHDRYAVVTCAKFGSDRMIELVSHQKEVSVESEFGWENRQWNGPYWQVW